MDAIETAVQELKKSLNIVLSGSITIKQYNSLSQEERFKHVEDGTLIDYTELKDTFHEAKLTDDEIVGGNFFSLAPVFSQNNDSLSMIFKYAQLSREVSFDYLNISKFKNLEDIYGYKLVIVDCKKITIDLGQKNLLLNRFNIQLQQKAIKTTHYVIKMYLLSEERNGEKGIYTFIISDRKHKFCWLENSDKYIFISRYFLEKHVVTSNEGMINVQKYLNDSKDHTDDCTVEHIKFIKNTPVAILNAIGKYGFHIRDIINMVNNYLYSKNPCVKCHKRFFTMEGDEFCKCHVNFCKTHQTLCECTKCNFCGISSGHFKCEKIDEFYKITSESRKYCKLMHNQKHDHEFINKVNNKIMVMIASFKLINKNCSGHYIFWLDDYLDKICKTCDKLFFTDGYKGIVTYCKCHEDYCDIHKELCGVFRCLHCAKPFSDVKECKKSLQDSKKIKLITESKVICQQDHKLSDDDERNYVASRQSIYKDKFAFDQRCNVCRRMFYDNTGKIFCKCHPNYCNRHYIPTNECGTSIKCEHCDYLYIYCKYEGNKPTLEIHSKKYCNAGHKHNKIFEMKRSIETASDKFKNCRFKLDDLCFECNRTYKVAESGRVYCSCDPKFCPKHEYLCMEPCRCKKELCECNKKCILKGKPPRIIWLFRHAK